MSDHNPHGPKAWKRLTVSTRRWVRRLAFVVLSVGIGFSVYFALTQPAQESKDLKSGLQRTVTELRNDNQQLCQFFRSADAALGAAFSFAPTTPTGVGFKTAFIGLQTAARNVSTSPICPPPIPFVAHPSPSPTGSRTP